MKKTFILLFMLPLFAAAQTGIKFEHGQSWKDLQAKAKSENKYIFVDAWTTWCGPCVYMAKNIFPMENVGSFFNDKFINVKMQLDTTAKDNDEVKARYQDAHDLMVNYKVNVFPTYLFFDPSGKLVHRGVGSDPDPEKFIAKGKDAIDPGKQYYTLLEQYQGGKKEPAFLRQLAYTSRDAYDPANSAIVAKDYLASQQDLFTTDNIEFITDFTSSAKDQGFEMIIKNAAKYDAIKGPGYANKKIVDIVVHEEIYPKIFTRDAAVPNWTELTATLNKKYPAHAAEALAGAKVSYYQNKGDWDNFQKVIVDYMKKYGSNTSPAELNNFAWTVFENCRDMACVKEALEWSKRSFKDNNNPMFIDTYANILYKLGKKEEAVTWEEKALGLAAENEKPGYQETVDKMKKGEKTWKD